MGNVKIAKGYAGEARRQDKRQPIEGVAVSEQKPNIDDRQTLIVYLRSSDPYFAGFSQSYVAICERGVVKAWHYHLKQTDLWFVPYGKIKVGLFDSREGSPTSGVVNEIIMGGGMEITLSIPPGVYHGYVTLSDMSILINTTNQPYDPSDEYRIPWDDKRIPFDWDILNR